MGKRYPPLIVSVVRWQLLLLFAVIVAGAEPGVAPAAAPDAPATVNVTVNSAADAPLNPLNATQCQTAPGNTTCTLRAAVMFANRNGGGTINLPALPGGAAYQLSIAPTGTNDDASGDLNIGQDLTLVGGGAPSTIIDGGQLDRVLFINQFVPVTGSVVNVSVSGVTVRNGKASYGGGIYNFGNLTLNNSTVSGNSSSGAGGGIALDAGTLTLNNSTVSGNPTAGNGGGIWNDGDVTLNNSTVSGNSSGGNGAGIYNGAFGARTLILNNSTVSGNIASAIGGGIYNNAGTTRLRNATIAFNTAGLDYSGGGVYNVSGATVLFRNTILTGNKLADDTPIDCTGTLTSENYNLISNLTGCTIANDNASNLKSVSASLDVLRNNGGPTLTHALLAGSPAIDAGDPAGCADDLATILTTDQRGFNRHVDGGSGSARCDIGAFEDQVIRTLFLPLTLR